MLIFKFRLAFFTALVFAAVSLGCAQSPTLVSDIEWAKAVTVSKDPFTLQTTTRGAYIEVPGSTTFLRAVKSDRLPIDDMLVIYVIVKTKEWKFIDRAFAISFGQIPTNVLDRDVRFCNRYGCSLAEHVTMPTSRQFLMKYIDSGLDIKLVGKRGEEHVFLPPAYIAAFLASLAPVAPQRS